MTKARILFSVPVLLLTLGGCVLDDVRAGLFPQTTATPAPATKEVAPPLAAPPVKKNENNVAALREPTRPVKAKPPAPDPSVVIGMAPKQLRGLLGPPAFQRLDKPAQIWRYTSGACVLDVFLYEGDGGGPVSATHFEFRSLGKDAVAPKACFADMLDARKQQQQG